MSISRISDSSHYGNFLEDPKCFPEKNIYIDQSDTELHAPLLGQQKRLSKPTLSQTLQSRMAYLNSNIKIPSTIEGKISLLVLVCLFPFIDFSHAFFVSRYLKEEKKAHAENLRILSNISGIKEPYNGYFQHKMLNPASKALETLVIEDRIKKPILSAINMSRNAHYSDYLKKIKEGHLVILETGYYSKKGGHFMNIVIYKDKMIICNRGDRAIGQNIYEYYQIDPSLWNEGLISKILTSRHRECDSINTGIQHQSKICYEDLPKALKAKKLEFPLLMTSKNQRVGNCSIASLKAAFQASCFLLEGETKQAAFNAKIYKKSFTLALRKQAVESVSGTICCIFNFFYGSKIVTEAQAKIKRHEKKLKFLEEMSKLDVSYEIKEIAIKAGINHF
jgi:hypothetical protein